MDEMRIEPLAAAFTGTITPPGSKSLTNRAMVLAALADGDCELSNVLFADDTRVMIEGLQQLGFALDVNEADHAVRVTPDDCLQGSRRVGIAAVHPGVGRGQDAHFVACGSHHHERAAGDGDEEREGDGGGGGR